MISGKSFSNVRWLIVSTALLFAAAAPAKAAFHFWNIQEVYTNSSGSLQFIEFTALAGGQQSVINQQIFCTNLSNTQTNTFTITANLPGDSAGHTFLIGTAGIHAAGGPTPDYATLPSNFFFVA